MEIENGKRKILLVCIASINILAFRQGMIRTLKEQGHEIHTITFDEKYRAEAEALGVVFHYLPDENRGLNPFRILTLKNRYAKMIAKIEPDYVFTYGLKPNLFATLAAKKTGVKEIYATVEGAGDVFVHNSLKWKLIRFVVCQMYKRAFKIPKKVFFQNKSDPVEFCQRGLLKEEQCIALDGVGVDVDKFTYTPMKNYRTFLMVARMIRTKGVLTYCEAAKLVKEKYPDAVFNYVGAESALTLEDIKEYTDSGIVNYLGTSSDMRPFFADCTAHVLPTHREGFGLVNAEAGATGRPAITSDAIGARDTVIDGYNGFLVKIGDAQELAEKIVYMIEHPEETEQMGKNSRKLAEERFDQLKVNAAVIAFIK